MPFKCSKEGCEGEASMQCPICQKYKLEAFSHFCSQDCFKSVWTTHKLHHPGVYDPFPGFSYTGTLRPWPYGPSHSFVPTEIERPDYAEKGVPISELDVRNRAATTIPIFNTEEQEKLGTVCRVRIISIL